MGDRRDDLAGQIPSRQREFVYGPVQQAPLGAESIFGKFVDELTPLQQLALQENLLPYAYAEVYIWEPDTLTMWTEVYPEGKNRTWSVSGCPSPLIAAKHLHTLVDEGCDVVVGGARA